MKNLVGLRWKDLTKEIQEGLLEGAFCINGITGKEAIEGECIVDLTEDLSVSGIIIDGEIIIDNNAILYNPAEGIITEVMTVTEAATLWGITETAVRKAIKAGKFIEGVDYRKAGRITLITAEAMERVYGKLK